MMDGFGLFLRKELREGLRTNRVLVVAAIFALLGIISPLTAKYTPELLKSLGATGNGITIVLPTPTVKDAIAQFIKNVAGTGILVALLLPMGLVAREKERGTAAFVLTKPLTRAAFLSAKLAALGLTLTLGVAIGALATYWYTALLFAPIALGGFVVATLLVLLSLMVYASFTFLGSTLTNGQLPAAGIGLACWIVVSILGVFPSIEQYTPAGLLNPASQVALGTAPQHLGVSIAASVGLLAVVLVAAWASFRGQELGTGE
jgi:ABC-2 type transport system permease protein